MEHSIPMGESCSSDGLCFYPDPFWGGFVVRYRRVDVLPSALRHGIDEADIDHAVVVEEVADDPIRYLVIGPDRSGNFLEMVVM